MHIGKALPHISQIMTAYGLTVFTLQTPHFTANSVFLALVFQSITLLLPCSAYANKEGGGC